RSGPDRGQARQRGLLRLRHSGAGCCGRVLSRAGRREGSPRGRTNRRPSGTGRRRQALDCQRNPITFMTPSTLTVTAETVNMVHELERALFGAAAEGASKLAPAMILAMLDAGDGISDLIFSPGRPSQIERHGDLIGVQVPGIAVLHPEHTARVACELIGGNELVLRTLKEHGACDFSYGIPNCARFRVNVFRQRGTYAIVMRVIATKIPTIAELNLPSLLSEIADLKNGIVLVTGPTGSGKSSTLAAIVNLINETRADHIVTIEDPIEF